MQSGFNVDLTAPLSTARWTHVAGVVDARQGFAALSMTTGVQLPASRHARLLFQASLCCGYYYHYYYCSSLSGSNPLTPHLFLQSNPSPSFSMCAAHHQHATAALTSKPIDDGSAGSAASAAPAAYMSQLPSELLPSLMHVSGWFIVFITLCCICSL